jgi:hypothetical protein
VALKRTVRTQFGAPFTPYGGLRRRRNEVEYPSHPDETVDTDEAAQALASAEAVLEAADKLLPHLNLFA